MFEKYHCLYHPQEEKRTLQRELTRAKITENRVAAAVIGHEWKDAGNDKVIPVKQWLEERRFMQVQRICPVAFKVFISCSLPESSIQ